MLHFVVSGDSVSHRFTFKLKQTTANFIFMQADLKIKQTSANILLNCPAINFDISTVLTVTKVVTWPTIPLQLHIRIKDMHAIALQDVVHYKARKYIHHPKIQ